MVSEIGVATFVGAFILGLAHTLEPCEDKAVVSLYAFWASERWMEGILLVVLYGLGMALIDASLGFLFAFVGVNLLEAFKTVLELIAGLITVVFGFFMLTGWSIIHVAHHHNGVSSSGPKVGERLRMSTALLFGLIRGLPPCPFELAVFIWAASMGSVLIGTLTVFIFGLGTTAGLIPLGFLMGGISGVAKKTKYAGWIPKISGLTIIVIGIALIVFSLTGG
jgi:sulfite exporter TauE/SafE